MCAHTNKNYLKKLEAWIDASNWHCEWEPHVPLHHNNKQMLPTVNNKVPLYPTQHPELSKSTQHPIFGLSRHNHWHPQTQQHLRTPAQTFTLTPVINLFVVVNLPQIPISFILHQRFTPIHLQTSTTALLSSVESALYKWFD